MDSEWPRGHALPIVNRRDHPVSPLAWEDGVHVYCEHSMLNIARRQLWRSSNVDCTFCSHHSYRGILVLHFKHKLVGHVCFVPWNTNRNADAKVVRWDSTSLD